MTPQKTKQILLEHCTNYLKNRKYIIEKTLASIEEALFEEGKSTAGDKHHTGRAMLQIDRENSGKQLQEIERLEQVLLKIQQNSKSNTIRLGSVVHTTTNNYFLALSASKVEVDHISYYCVSVGSPIGKLLLGKREGESFIFNETTQIIEKVI